MLVLIIPFFMGALGVLQNTWNKNIANEWGLIKTLHMNNIALLGTGVLVWLSLKFVPESYLPEIYRNKPITDGIGLRHLLPGIAGYIIILGLPWAIQKVGAMRVFVAVVLAQLIVSILWDYFVESIIVTPTRIIGAILALMGVVVASR
jgi:bacterial/archaeal transporter family-2 protein